MRAVRMRPFNHVGPGQSEAFVVASFAAQLGRIGRGAQEAVMRVGALDRWRDFLDVRDVCRAYALALRAGQPRRIGDVLEALIARAGLRPRIEEKATRLRPTDIERTAGNAAKARALLGWEPRVPWEQTMDDVMEAVRLMFLRGL